MQIIRIEDLKPVQGGPPSAWALRSKVSGTHLPLQQLLWIHAVRPALQHHSHGRAV